MSESKTGELKLQRGPNNFEMGEIEHRLRQHMPGRELPIIKFLLADPRGTEGRAHVLARRLERRGKIWWITGDLLSPINAHPIEFEHDPTELWHCGTIMLP